MKAAAEIRAGNNRTERTALADQFACEKPLDWNGPVTEVLSLDIATIPVCRNALSAYSTAISSQIPMGNKCMIRCHGGRYSRPCVYALALRGEILGREPTLQRDASRISRK